MEGDDPEVHRPLYVADVLANVLNMGGSRPYLHLADGPTLSVDEMRDATNRYLQALAQAGVGRGTRVAMLALNRPECLHVTNALQLLAAVYVPIHPLASAADQLGVLRAGAVSVLIADPAPFGERAGGFRAALPGLRLLGLGAGLDGDDLFALAAAIAPARLVAPRVGPQDPIRLGYSGGTTGRPKAMLSRQRTGMVALQMMMSEWEWPDPPHVLTCAPLTHAGGALSLPVLLRGGTLRVLPRFEAGAVLAAIEAHRVNCMLLVPTMIYALLDHPGLDDFNLSSLATVFYGASAIAPARLREAIERIGPVFSQFYGQAEVPMTISLLRKADHDATDLRRLASCGRPNPFLRVELLDGEHRPVADGAPGEICVQGPLVMDGYDDPALTAEAFRGGWHHTGDVAVRDPGGFLRIVDRTRDIIVSGGFNIYPREIEDVLAGHPAVAQAAVIGTPDPTWGEAVTAIVVCRPGRDVTRAVLRELVAAAKGAYQAPKRIEFADAIPQTAVGKPDKRALRERYAAPPPA